MLHCIPQSGEVWGISVQRDSHEGYVFAAGSTNDGVLRIFDIRYSTICYLYISIVQCSNKSH
jgi:hypothetical protein